MTGGPANRHPTNRIKLPDDGDHPAPATRPGNSFSHRSEPLGPATRVTGTPRVSLNTEGHGNVLVRLYDAAPDSTAVLFDQQVSLLRSGTTSFDLRSTDWTLPAGHALAVEIGTIEPGYGLDSDWIDTPSGEVIAVHDVELALALDNPADDAAEPGARAPWLDSYLLMNTKPLPTAAPTFTMPTDAA